MRMGFILNEHKCIMIFHSEKYNEECTQNKYLIHIQQYEILAEFSAFKVIHTCSRKLAILDPSQKCMPYNASENCMREYAWFHWVA